MQIETRHAVLTEPLEVRADDQKRQWISGYAAVYNSPSKDLGGFTEIIAPGAFTETLRGGYDFRSLVNHDPEKLLGRAANQTLILTENRNGLKFESMVPDTTYGRDLVELLKLGTVSQCSFGFCVPDGGDEIACSKDGLVVRTLTRIDLIEVSIVATPAYTDTSVSLRIDPAITGRIQALRQAPDLTSHWMRLRRLQAK